MYLCARDIDLPVSMNILVDFGTVPTEWYFLIYKKKHRARVKFGIGCFILEYCVVSLIRYQLSV
jgi:hypothetical protein